MAKTAPAEIPVWRCLDGCGLLQRWEVNPHVLRTGHACVPMLAIPRPPVTFHKDPTSPTQLTLL